MQPAKPRVLAPPRTHHPLELNRPELPAGPSRAFAIRTPGAHIPRGGSRRRALPRRFSRGSRRIDSALGALVAREPPASPDELRAVLLRENVRRQHYMPTYTRHMGRTLVQRLHNPHGYICACDPDCFCNATRIGRAIKWWIPGRLLAYVGIHHRNRELEEWKRTHGSEALREWKRQQERPNE
jgi:hypothetical protein